jgi:hypothetical protein
MGNTVLLCCANGDPKGLFSNRIWEFEEEDWEMINLKLSRMRLSRGSVDHFETRTSSRNGSMNSANEDDHHATQHQPMGKFQYKKQIASRHSSGCPPNGPLANSDASLPTVVRPSKGRRAYGESWRATKG